MVAKFGCDYEEIRRKHLKDPHVVLFRLFRKRLSVILNDVEDNEYGYSKRLFSFGASELILESCSHYIDENGNRKEIKEQNEFLKNAIEKFTSDALETLCLAYKDLQEGEGGLTHEDRHENEDNYVVEKSGLTLVAIFDI